MTQGKPDTGDVILDTFGLLCPLPVIKASEKIKLMDTGQVLELISTDSGVVKDMQDWCSANGHIFINSKQDGGLITVWVKKGG